MNRSLLHMTDVAGGPIWDIGRYLAAQPTTATPNPAARTSAQSLKSTTDQNVTSSKDKAEQKLLVRAVLDDTHDRMRARAMESTRRNWSVDEAKTAFKPLGSTEVTEPFRYFKHLFDMRTSIYDDCIDVYERERLRLEFFRHDWKSTIQSFGEPAVTLWKSLLIDELHTKKRFTLPIDNPDMLKYLTVVELDHLSKLYIVRLETVYNNLHKLLKGQYSNKISQFDRESIKRMPEIIPEIMQALSDINPRPDAVVKYYGRISEYTKMLKFIAAQTRS